MLKPTVGLRLDGATVAGGDERGRVGEPVWGPMRLLADLEVRVGLVAAEARAAVRAQRWAARLAALVAAGGESFLARSFRVDPIGTAEMTLMWRDALVDAGWAGTPVPGGGPRLEAFAALEAMATPVMIAGAADRLAAVEVEVAMRSTSPYAELTFADDRRVWPYRWQRIFELLAERGARIRDGRVERGTAAARSDLGRLQRLMTGDAVQENGEARRGMRGADAAQGGDERVGGGQSTGGEIEDSDEDDGASAGGGVRGDGSVVLLRAATGIEAADAVAALVGAARRERVAIVRSAAAGALDEALAAHGRPTLGVSAASRWRAALQVLPLAVDMVFAPVDPRRVLELLGLAVSPFGWRTRYALSRALCDAPGIGDVRWQEAKGRLRERIAAASVREIEVEGTEPEGGEVEAAADGPSNGEPARVATAEGIARAEREIALIEEWLEPVRYDARHGAPIEAIAAAVTRVREWLRRRLAAGGGPVDGVAFAQCEQLLAILAEDARPVLDRLEVQRLLDAVGAAGAAAEVTVEEAGRVDHVDHAGALLAPRDTVIWWQFVAETAPPPHRARWRRTELEALAACGVVPIEPAALLAEETRQWRTAVLAARRRLVLVLPETDRGERTAPHPLWDEIVARLALDEAQLGLLSVSVGDLLTNEAAGPSTPRSLTLALRSGRTENQGAPAGDQGAHAGYQGAPAGHQRAPTQARLGLDVVTEALTPLALPPARPVWRVAPGLIAPATRWTVSSLQALLECPLRWVLGEAAGIVGHSVPTLPDGSMLNGAIGHRLVAELVGSGGLTRAREEIDAALDRLLPGVAARLLQPGMAVELAQLRHQLREGIDALAALIDRGGLTIIGIEEEIAGAWMGGTLAGRLDVRVRDRDGREAILDLKWGHGSYRALLEDGRAVQLALYAQARKLVTGEPRVPPAAYYSLGRGRLLATDVEALGLAGAVEAVAGPSIEAVIDRMATSLPAAQQALAAGEIHVTGVAGASPLLDALGVPPGDQERHYRIDADRGDGRERRDGPPGCKYCRFGPICGRSWESAE